jgi:hypothetical protein
LLSQNCPDFDQIYGFSFGVLAFKYLLLSFSPGFASLHNSLLLFVLCLFVWVFLLLLDIQQKCRN